MAVPIYSTVDVDGLEVFYREAGNPDAPTLLLLHGFPSSSHMFRDLIPLLSPHLRVVAPDLPGFGRTGLPSRDKFVYNFANLTKVVGRFTEVIGIPRFALYVFDHGAPIGLRLALAHPGRITAIISQNGNVYREGLSANWEPIKRYWRDRTDANRNALRSLLTPKSVRWQYTHGVRDPSRISPDGVALDSYYLTRLGADEAQLDLFLDYASNIALYPAYQAYFRKFGPPLLAVWGSHDPFFLPAGAKAFKHDLPNAEVRFVDTGRFAIETHAREIAKSINEFLCV